MSKFGDKASGQHHPTHRRLQTYSVVQQDYGTYFASFPWQVFMTATFRISTTALGASKASEVFLERLERSLGRATAVCALERRHSGCGYSPIALHWHLLLQVPGREADEVRDRAQTLWSERYGNCDVRLYDPEKQGAYYIAKTARQADFEWTPWRLEQLQLCDSSERPLLQQEHAYIPEHARDLVYGTTLRLRNLDNQVGQGLKALGGDHGRTR